MNKINPLYLLLIFASIALFMVYQTAHIENKTAHMIQSNTVLEQTGRHVKVLKDHWKNPKESQKRIDAILGKPAFKQKLRKKEQKKGTYYVQLDALTAIELDKLTNKFFNESVSIKKMTMIRNGDKNVTLSLEFSL